MLHFLLINTNRYLRKTRQMAVINKNVKCILMMINYFLRYVFCFVLFVSALFSLSFMR